MSLLLCWSHFVKIVAFHLCNFPQASHFWSPRLSETASVCSQWQNAEQVMKVLQKISNSFEVNSGMNLPSLIMTIWIYPQPIYVNGMLREMSCAGHSAIPWLRQLLLNISDSAIRVAGICRLSQQYNLGQYHQNFEFMI